MNNSMISAMVSMNAIQKRLNVMGDNLANLDTTGYKRKEASFEDTLTTIQGQPQGHKLPGRSTPLGFNEGFGSRLVNVTFNFSQGPIKQTGNSTDLAIEGNGLFAVQANGSEAWTREGDFQVHPDPNDPRVGYLTTNQGYYVLGTDNQPITVPTNGELQVAADGTLNSIAGSTTTRVGQIKLVVPERPEGLVQKDNNLFGLVPGANVNDVLVDANTLGVNSPNRPSIRQGALEGSNVDVAKEMTDMLQVQRAYQLSARALSSSDAMMGMANHLRG